MPANRFTCKDLLLAGLENRPALWERKGIITKMATIRIGSESLEKTMPGSWDANEGGSQEKIQGTLSESTLIW